LAESIVQVTEGSGKKLHTYNRTIGANSVEDEVMLLGEQYLPTYTIVSGTTSLATADSHLLQIMAGASLNVYIRSIKVYQFGAATTANILFTDVIRLSTAGTGGTAGAAMSLDTTDSAAGSTNMTLPTVKGTETATVDREDAYVLQTASASLGVPRSSLIHEWDYSKDLRSKALRIPAGTANGIAVKSRVAIAAATCHIVVKFCEANF
jgi:hypothetical protein